MQYYRRLPKFEYLAPKSVEEAIAILDKKKGEVRIMGGGTIVVHQIKERIGNRPYLMSLKAIPNFAAIEFDSDIKCIKIGPMAWLQSVADSQDVRNECAILAEACSRLGTFQIRSMGTIGGNIGCRFATAESVPPLIALQAECTIRSVSGDRTVPVEDIHSQIKDGEIITEVKVPASNGFRWGYHKFAVREKADYATASAAAVAILDGTKCKELTIGLGGVTLPTMRSRRAEEALKGQKITDKLIEEAARIASEDGHMHDDINFSAEYKKEVLRVLVKRVLKQIFEQRKEV